MRVNSKVQQLVEQQQVQRTKRPFDKTSKGAEFAEILKNELNLKLSGHAQTRLQSRGIELNRDEWERVRNGVERAAEKGSRESLVMLEGIAFVISVNNRTVITAVPKEQLKENVFTNIDSAVFV